MRLGLILIAGLAALGSVAPAGAQCTVENFGRIDISMDGRRPVTDATINGHPVRFLVDSGAFYSVIGPAMARELGLSTTPLPQLQMRGVGGTSSTAVTKVDELGIAGVKLNKIEFVVGGSDTGFAGVIGQNVLGLRDAEYDLHHGAVRLMLPKDCDGQNLAYWASGIPVSMLKIEKTDARNPHTIGTVLLNGVKLRAGFDTGAAGTVVTPKAARKAGVKTDDPGVKAAGYGSGFGSRQVQAFVGKFDSIDVGGEQLRNVQLRIQELGGDIDMLIGVDFFLAHRVYVSNAFGRMYFTYEGGPVFGVSPARAVSGDGETIAIKDSAGEPTDAAGYSARATAFAAKRDYASALADLNKAIEMAPDNGQYRYERSKVRLSLQQRGPAADDLKKARTMLPADPDILLAHAAMSLSMRDPKAAKDDAAAADAALAPQAQDRLNLARLYGLLGDHEAALANFSGWLKFHPNDGVRPVAFNGRCAALTQLDRDLDKALDDCDTANRLQPNNPTYLNNRALVRLKRGDNDGAVSDLNIVLNLQPNRAVARYLRGLALERLGKTADARRDKAAALAVDPHVAERAERVGLDAE
jgi:tetratricopeptide (TPR) repeat protein